MITNGGNLWISGTDAFSSVIQAAAGATVLDKLIARMGTGSNGHQIRIFERNNPAQVNFYTYTTMDAIVSPPNNTGAVFTSLQYIGGSGITTFSQPCIGFEIVGASGTSGTSGTSGFISATTKWTSATSYVAGAVVDHLGSTFVALTNPPAGTVPGMSSANWEQIAQGPYYISNSSHSFTAGSKLFAINVSDIGDGAVSKRNIQLGDTIRAIEPVTTGGRLEGVVTAVGTTDITVNCTVASGGGGPYTTWLITHIPAGQTVKTVTWSTPAGTYYPPFVDANNAALEAELLYTDADYNYNPSTNTLVAGTMQAKFQNPTGATYSGSGDADVTIDAAVYDMARVTFTTSATTRNINIVNLTQGRRIEIFVHNSHTATKIFNLTANTAGTTGTTGNVYLTKKGAALGAVRSDGLSAATLAASTGYAYVVLANITGSLPCDGVIS